MRDKKLQREVLLLMLLPGLFIRQTSINSGGMEGPVLAQKRKPHVLHVHPQKLAMS